MNKKKYVLRCLHKPCNNISRKFEGRFCCIECADAHDGVISNHLWEHKVGKCNEKICGKTYEQVWKEDI